VPTRQLLREFQSGHSSEGRKDDPKCHQGLEDSVYEQQIRCYKSGLYSIFDQLNNILKNWVMWKYKVMREKKLRARHWLRRISHQQPQLFAHWHFGARPVAGR
jgi:hypothetical protein